MDPDILAADQLQLNRIKAQEYRNDVAHAKLIRDAHLLEVKTHLTWVQTAHNALPDEPDSAVVFRRQMALKIVERYFTPETAPGETAAADASTEAARFRLVLEAVLTASEATVPPALGG
jgi:hypothetical protein